MNKTLKVRFVQTVCLSLFFVLVSGILRVQASSADIVISSDQDSYSKGDYVDIYIDIEAEVFPGDFEGYLLYPSEMLEYVSGPELASGGEGVIKLNDSVTSSSRNDRRYSLRFRALGTGEAKISFRDTPELYEFEEGYLMSVSVSEMTVKIESSKSASADNSLAVLKISPGTLAPEFSKTVSVYETTVKEDVEKLIVSAAATDTNATIEVSGNQKLEIGENRIEIKVTAENGESKTYVIKCIREGETQGSENNSGDRQETGNSTEEKPENPDNDQDSRENQILKNGISAIEDGGKTKLYINNEYELVTDTTGIEIPEGYKKTSMVIDGVSIPVYFSEDADTYMLLLLKNTNGEISLYNYDRTEKTIQKYLGKSTETTVKHVMTDSIEALELANSYEKSLSTLTLIIAVLSGISMALLIVVIRMALKSKGDGNDL
ncbi:MAG: cadherin-like beta sandwich domain-containing protein [Lachnospiraceae bacterium]|nr:cadherin-like beta sandwich domain-containing protein [Lachnospiraceae bacterium]